MLTLRFGAVMALICLMVVAMAALRRRCRKPKPMVSWALFDPPRNGDFR